MNSEENPVFSAKNTLKMLVESLFIFATLCYNVIYKNTAEFLEFCFKHTLLFIFVYQNAQRVHRKGLPIHRSGTRAVGLKFSFQIRIGIVYIKCGR